MRYPNGTLIGDLDDSVSTTISSSISMYKSSSLDENLTTYSLLPVIINEPPTITKTINEASKPNILSYSELDYKSTRALYVHPDGNIKVLAGESFQLIMEAEQPQTLNVENGKPVVKPANSGLNYLWRKDGTIISPQNSFGLASQVVIENNVLTINNIQPEHAGVYTCEALNDAGTTVSEPLTLEVLILDYNALFYTNIITNPTGIDGTSNWNSSNNLFKTKALSSINSTEFLKPNNIDIFGYTVNMMHPQPHQLSSPVVRSPNYNTLMSDPKASYFTRDSLYFEKKGGSFLVKAYQDIDLTDIEGLIKGGVLGVQGVRAVFSCYIGSAISQYIPTRNMLNQNYGRKSELYYDLKKPRLSRENILKAGSPAGISETITVTLEEFDHGTQIASVLLNDNLYSTTTVQRIELLDPWKKRLSKYNKPDYRESILSVTDELFLQNGLPVFTYGQYVEFNKAIIEKLNKRTNKIRITMSFFTDDPRMYELWKEGMDQSSVVFETVQYQAPSIDGEFAFGNIAQETVEGLLRKRPDNQNKQLKDILPLANDPRGMVTGLNLILLPVFDDKAKTDYVTRDTFKYNGVEDLSIVIPYA